MSKKKRKKKKNGDNPEGEPYAPLYTLGEALRARNPEMADRFEALQEEGAPDTTGAAVDSLMDVIIDTMPFNWADPELFEEGLHLVLLGQHTEAACIFQSLVQDDPQMYPAYHLLGHIAGSLQNYKEEVEYYRKAQKIRSDYPQLYISLGVAYWLMGKEKKSFAAFRQAAGLGPEFQAVDQWFEFIFYRLGRFLSQNGIPRDKQIEERDRVLARGFLMMGNAYLEHGYHPAARQAYKKAVRLYPEFAEGYYQLGAIHIKRLRNPKRASKYLEKAEQLFIQQNDLNAATFAQQRHKTREDVKEKEKAAEEWFKEGLRLQQIGMYQGAIDAYKMAIGFKEEFPDAFYNMGVAYGSLEDTGQHLIHKAIWAFKQAVQIKTDFVHGYVALGAAHIKENEPQNSLRVLQKALQIDPHEPNALYYAAIAQRMTGDPEEAVAIFKRAGQLKPDSIQVHFHLGLTLVDMERFQEACEAFQEVLRIKPDFADGHYMLGTLFLDKIGEVEKGASHLKKAEKLFIKLEDYRRSDQIQQILSTLPV